MEAEEYQTLFDMETSYWWFRALRAVLLETCRHLKLGPSARILDAGCGTGKNIEVLGHELGHHTYGFDISSVAARYWPRRHLRQMCLASVNAIPFRDESFDVVLSVDLLECDGVIEHQAFQELCRVVRNGGYLIVVVPAYRWLMSPEHHRAVRASRRYTRLQLLEILQQAPVRLMRLTYLFTTVFLPIAVYRLWQRLDGRAEVERPRSELQPLPRGVNEMLFRVVDWERRLLSFMDLPLGSSILAVVQKTAH